MSRVGATTYVESGPLRLWTERSGDPADPAVLLIMGAMAQGIGWPDALVSRLVAGGRQVIRYDHRDTGQSDSVDFDAAPYGMAVLVRDAPAVPDGHGIAAAHVVGASIPIFPPGHAEALAAAIPGARLAEVPGMGHTFLSPGLPERVAGLVLEHTAG